MKDKEGQRGFIRSENFGPIEGAMPAWKKIRWADSSEVKTSAPLKDALVDVIFGVDADSSEVKTSAPLKQAAVKICVGSQADSSDVKTSAPLKPVHARARDVRVRIHPK